MTPTLPSTLPLDFLHTRPEMERLLEALHARTGETRLVGGAVRDTLLGQAVHDIDFATRLDPQVVMVALAQAQIKAIPTGLAHGTVTAVLAGEAYEITSLRRDIATDGRHAEIAYTQEWQDDAARRDFTMNALYADPITGEVYDYFNGQADLAAGSVRFIGLPLERIAEDHLRILRFFRFQARFGSSTPESEALHACVLRANDLMALSRERIADELLKILSLPNPAPICALMLQHDILKPVLPEISNAETLQVLVATEERACVPPAPIRRLAALLPPVPKLAEAIGFRLKLSNALRKHLMLLAARTDTDTENPRALAYAIGVPAAQDRLLLQGEDCAALHGWQPPRFPLMGGALIQAGMAQGVGVSSTLKALEAQWVAQGFPQDVNWAEWIAQVVEKSRIIS